MAEDRPAWEHAPVADTLAEVTPVVVTPVVVTLVEVTLVEVTSEAADS